MVENHEFDYSVIEKAKLGDNGAFGEIYEAYFKKIFSYIYFRVGYDELLAEDLCNSVFLKGFQNIHTIDQVIGFNSWIFRIAHNVIVDYFRQCSRHGLDVTDELDHVIDTSNFECQVELSDEIQSAMANLQPNYREVLIMHYYCGLSCNEIAENLNISVSKVKSRMFRSRMKMGELLTHDE